MLRLRILPLLLIAVPGILSAATSRPIPVKVVVIAMFEQGDDTGDTPGEYQDWVERDHLTRIFATPAAYHDVRMNDQGEMAILTGRGTARAASSIMAIGLDARFDFRHAYWIVAGIAGGSPDRVSLGSAVWARYVVDGDLGYEIDAREIPPDWSTGFIPFGKKVPFEQPFQPWGGEAYALNPTLSNWAFNLTRTVKLDDSEKLKDARSHFDGATSQLSPGVFQGDTLSSSTFWHGKLMDAWATRWVAYMTEGKGSFATTAMEDTGTLQSLTALAHAGRVDINRVMVLRTVSNYDQQPRGLSATESLASQHLGSYSAYLPSIEAAYRVGHAVVSELLAHWPQYENTIPSDAEVRTNP